MYSERTIPAWLADHTTSTRNTIPAVVELAPSQTSRDVVTMAAAVARNQRRICPE